MAGGRNRLTGCLGLLWESRVGILALGVFLWLCGYFVADGWQQRRAFWILLPVLLLNGDLLIKTFRETRWLWAVSLLIGYQGLSRLWSAEGAALTGNAFDILVVLSVLSALVTIGRQEDFARWLAGGLAGVAALVALFSLFAFYGSADRFFAVDRLKNLLIYRGGNDPGLNAVLTGMLCGFGAVVAASFGKREHWRIRRVLWMAGLAVLVFGLMATQSRGAMIALCAGFAVLVYFARLRLWPSLLTIAVALVSYFVTLFFSKGGTEAANDLLERGTTGRFGIYEWFWKQIEPLDAVIGKGMGTPASIPEDQLGWFVEHPHSAYLCQLFLTGAIGLGLLFWILWWAFRKAWKEAKDGDILWLALLASGAMAVFFDCGQIFSIYSPPRIELLLLAVPAALVMGKEKW